MNTVFIPCACIKQSTVCIFIQKRNPSLGKYSFGFCCKKSGYFTKPVKNITNWIFICHKQVNNDTKSNSYSLKRQQNYFCNRTLKGIEAMNMIKKGKVNDRNDSVLNEVKYINQLFG